MRKIFGGALLFSVIGAVIFGGVLAWQNTQTSSGNTSTVGSMSWILQYTPAVDSNGNNVLIGPDGATVEVGQGAVQNLGDFNLGFLGGEVIVTNVTQASGNSGSPACNMTNFSGTVAPNSGTSSAPIGVGETGGSFVVNMTVTAGAPTSCIGATVSYDVNVTVGTLSGDPQT